MKLLLLGATGLVGRETLNLALSRASISDVIAPTRAPLAPSARLVNPVASRLEDCVPSLASYGIDAVICALGTTRAKAGSKEAFRYVDRELPIAFAKAAHAAGVPTYVIVSALGASVDSLSFYYRTKGRLNENSGISGFDL